MDKQQRREEAWNAVLNAARGYVDDPDCWLCAECYAETEQYMETENDSDATRT